MLVTVTRMHPDPVVEEFAQRRFKLESLLAEHSAVIAKEPGYELSMKKSTNITLMVSLPNLETGGFQSMLLKKN